MREGKFRLIPRGKTKDVRCEMDDVRERPPLGLPEGRRMMGEPFS